MRKIILTMVFWGLAAASLGLFVNLFHPRRIDYIKKPPPVVVEDPALPPPMEIDVIMASNFFLMGEYNFVDARSRVQFKRGHIEGALSLPWDDFEKYYEGVVPTLKSKPAIVVYCDGAACESSRLLARKLQQEGYPELYVFFGGWEEWIEMELPVEEGA